MRLLWSFAASELSHFTGFEIQWGSTRAKIA
jgi:hypothetical protein